MADIANLLDLLIPAGAWLLSHAETVLDSNFVTALAGAGAGAYGAQWIVERSERKLRLLEEIRATNAAITLAVSILNTFCALKGQHVRDLKEKFDKGSDEIRNALANLHERPRVPMDFQVIMMPRTPSDLLQTLVFEKLSPSARGLSALGTLLQNLDSLAEALRSRNALIEEFRRNLPRSQEVADSMYFGLTMSNGYTDRRYADAIDAISFYTDACIIFSKFLVDDLAKRGRLLVEKLGKGAPKLNEVDFTKATEHGLIPPAEQYKDWIDGFREFPAAAPGKG